MKAKVLALTFVFMSASAAWAASDNVSTCPFAKAASLQAKTTFTPKQGPDKNAKTSVKGE